MYASLVYKYNKISKTKFFNKVDLELKRRRNGKELSGYTYGIRIEKLKKARHKYLKAIGSGLELRISNKDATINL